MATAITTTPLTQVNQGEVGGVQAFTEAASDTTGNTFTNTGRELVVFRNSDASSRTVSFKDKNGTALPGSPITLTAGQSTVVGPFPVQDYGTTVTVTTSNVLVKINLVTLSRPGVLTV